MNFTLEMERAARPKVNDAQRHNALNTKLEKTSGETRLPINMQQSLACLIH